MSSVKKLPKRADVRPADAWDLHSLFPDDDAWEATFGKFEKRISGYAKYRGRLGESAAILAACLKFDSELDRLGERLGTYAFLKSAEDQADSVYQRMLGRYQNVATRASEAASFMRPEILALPAKKLEKLLAAEVLQPYRLLLERLLRYRPHTLSEREENLLAMQGEMASAASRVFRQLLDTDLKFGLVENEKGQRVELTNATFSGFLNSAQREVRRTAFHRYYAQFVAHENTLAATLSGSIQKDVYYARARGYASSLAAALFPDNVPQSVYDNLIAAVRKHLPAVHRYYEIRRRKMRLKTIHHYDTYVPILSDLKSRHSWDEAVRLVIAALQPLGGDYCRVLEAGLRGRWCDRYPNQGKQSGAFSCGSYDADPYILMNYKPDVLDDVFTLAHEAGHSMHSYHSARQQPFRITTTASLWPRWPARSTSSCSASTCWRRPATTNNGPSWSTARSTGSGPPLSDRPCSPNSKSSPMAWRKPASRSPFKRSRTSIAACWRTTSVPDFTVDEELALECLRIPHFYRAFYVYKYATGLAAAIALSRRVLQGGPRELADYLGFLQGGCSKDPLDLLRDAGVDMEQPQPVDTALARFETLVTELDRLL